MYFDYVEVWYCLKIVGSKYIFDNIEIYNYLICIFITTMSLWQLLHLDTPMNCLLHVAIIQRVIKLLIEHCAKGYLL